MPRYVVIRHETPPNYQRPLHWDLMLEQSGSLLTWALEAEPTIGQTQFAERLAAHRLKYLAYEGPVSGNRGTVFRWDSGEFEWREQTDDRMVVELTGSRLRANATLILENADFQRWIVVFSTD